MYANIREVNGFYVEPAGKNRQGFKFVIVRSGFETPARYVKWFKTREEAEAGLERMQSSSPAEARANAKPNVAGAM